MILDMYRMAEAYVATGAAFGPDTALDDSRRRLALLCERHEPHTPVYVLHPNGSGGVCLDRRELDSGEAWRLPFIKVAPNASYLTPVFKVDRKKGNTASKRATTRRFFQSLVDAQVAAADYFAAVCGILATTEFQAPGAIDRYQVDDAFSAAVAAIIKTERDGPSSGSTDSKKLTPLLCIAIDSEGRAWPGNDDRLVRWLLDAPERLTIYQTKSFSDPENAECPLTGRRSRLYSNALAGAGLNFANTDFRGSFSEQRDDRAWSRSGFSAEAADMLYIYKNHVAPTFLDTIAGSKALVIPAADVSDSHNRQRFYDRIQKTIEAERHKRTEDSILRNFKDSTSIATVTILWASFGQKYEEAAGFITGILPSRLAQLEQINSEYERRDQLTFPRDARYRRSFNLRLSLAAELLRRPGGAAVKHENNGPRRHAVLREIARCVYHGRPIADGSIWREIDATARAYLMELLNDPDYAGYQIGFEGPDNPKGKNQPALTLNGWARHVAMFLTYLSDDRIGVLQLEESMYEPKNERLRPLFADAKGIGADLSKVYVFLLGILYGHLISVQGKTAKFNVGAGALRKLRGGRIRADELDELYQYIWPKLLEYEGASGIKYGIPRAVHEINNEFGHIAAGIDDKFQLPDEKVSYYLLLGMALSYDFTRREESSANGSDSKSNNSSEGDKE